MVVRVIVASFAELPEVFSVVTSGHSVSYPDGATPIMVAQGPAADLDFDAFASLVRLLAQVGRARGCNPSVFDDHTIDGNMQSQADFTSNLCFGSAVLSICVMRRANITNVLIYEFIDIDIQ